MGKQMHALWSWEIYGHHWIVFTVQGVALANTAQVRNKPRNRRACPCQLEQLVAHRANFIKASQEQPPLHTAAKFYHELHVQGGQREQYVSHPTRIDEYGLECEVLIKSMSHPKPNGTSLVR